MKRLKIETAFDFMCVCAGVALALIGITGEPAGLEPQNVNRPMLVAE
jgi:hypothetical protein